MRYFPLFINLFWLSLAAWSAVPHHYERITSHYDIDLSPRVSPDGQWLAYVNRQTDNYDIWVRNLIDGRPHQITYHKADDFYPVWGPDNRTLAFVSQRSDAAGDIFLLKLKKRGKELKPKGRPERVSRYLGYDSYPTLSPDGKKIAWVSDRSGMDEIWFFNENTGNTLQLTYGGGTHPCWSPRLNFIAFTSFRANGNNRGDIYMINLKGPEPADSANKCLWDSREYPTYRVTRGPAMDGFASWSKDADKIVFLRFEHDTNSDGNLTPADHGALWRADVTPSPHDSVYATTWIDGFCPHTVYRAFPLTLYAYRVMQPWYADKIYASFDIDDNVDIYAIPDSGSLAKMPTAQQQLDFVKAYSLPDRIDQQIQGPLFMDWDAEQLNQDDKILLWQRCLAFHRVLGFFGRENSVSAKALYHIGVCHLLLGYRNSAGHYFQYLLDHYSQPKEILFHAELAQIRPHKHHLQARINRIAERYPGQTSVLATAQFEVGRAMNSNKALENALLQYQSMIEEKPDRPDVQAFASYQIANILIAQQDSSAALELLLDMMQINAGQKAWRDQAQELFFQLHTENKTEARLYQIYENLIQKHSNLPNIAGRAKLALADSLFHDGKIDSAYQLYDQIENDYKSMPDKFYNSRVGKARCMQQNGLYEQAFELLQNSYEQLKTVQPDFAAKVKVEWVNSLMRLGDELRFLQRYKSAKDTYYRAKVLDPWNMNAHRCYIECMYNLYQLEAAINEYEGLTKKHPENYILVYSHGLCLSYKGTEMADRLNDPEKIDPEMLHSSSNRVAQALVKDFTMIQPYVTLSFNYEMTEDYLNYMASMPKSFWVRIYETLLKPIRYIYNTITFKKADEPPRFYERAIHELTKAIRMNDENQNPAFEAMIAMNLANTHYKMGEFGYDKAYHYYTIKLKYDSSFAKISHKAMVFERLGHCALILEKVDNGPYYLQRAIQLYNDMGDEDHVLLNIKRLALLYETAELHHRAIQYYQLCAKTEEKKRDLSALAKSYRSIAFNYFLIKNSDQAIHYAQRALQLIESDRVEVIEAETRRFKVGFLDLYVPVPFFGIKPIGTASLKGLTTDDERALLYTIISESYIRMRRYEQAIEFYRQKLDIYEKYKDKTPKAAFLNHLARLYYYKGDAETAFQYYLQSLQICRDQDLIYGYTINSLNLAELMAKPSVWKQFKASNAKAFAKNLKLTRSHFETALEISRGQFYVLKERTQLLLAMAKCELVPVLLKKSSCGKTPPLTLADLSNAGRANRFLNQALEISLKYGFARQESIAHLLLGNMAQALGDIQGAVSHLQRVRWLSFNQRYFDLVWQSDMLLGDMINDLDKSEREKLSVSRYPLFYYKEAINIIEKLSPNTIGIHTHNYRHRFQEPYWRMIAYQNHRQHFKRAIDYSERLRLGLFSLFSTKGYIDLQDGRLKELNTLYHKVLQKHNQLKLDLISAVNRPQLSQKELSEIKQEIHLLKGEIDSVKTELMHQAPQLYHLYENEPVDMQTVRTLLGDRDVVLYFQRIQDSLACYAITPEKISLHSFAVQPLVDFMDNWRGDAQYNLVDSLDLQTFFQPLLNPDKAYDNVMIVPDIHMLTWPWIETIAQMGVDCPVYQHSSLKSMYLSSTRVGAIDKTCYFAGSETVKAAIPSDWSVLDPVSNSQVNSFYDQLSGMRDAGVIHLQVQSLWNELDPWYSRMGFSVKHSMPAVFHPADLFNQNIHPYLVILQIENPALLYKHPWAVFVWQEAFMRCGSRAVIFTLQQPAARDERFYKRFYQELADHQSGDTPLQSLNALAGEMKDLSFYLYGF